MCLGLYGSGAGRNKIKGSDEICAATFACNYLRVSKVHDCTAKVRKALKVFFH